MIAGQWILAARGVTIDKNNGALTLFCVMDGIGVAGYPAFVPLSIAAMLTRAAQDEERIEAHLSIEQQDLEVGRFPIAIDFQGALKTSSVIELQGFVVAGPGDIRFILRHGEHTLGNFALAIQGPAAQAAVH